MSELKQFKLPDVGEGLTEADIVKWLVHPGDAISINQIIVEIETAKALVELPSPYDGVVRDLLVPEGQTADVGTPIITVNVEAEAGVEGAPPAAPAEADTPAGASPQSAPPTEISTAPAEGAVEPGVYGSPAPKEERQAVLVGYGVKLGATKRRARKPASAAQGAPGAGTAEPARPGTPNGAAEMQGQRISVLAKPPVRKLAKDLGVDLSTLSGTGPSGSITRDDIQAAADTGAPAGQAAAAAPGTEPTGLTRVAAMRLASLPREERIAIRGVRKHTAAAMTSSAFTAPHVSEFLQIDITETMATTARLKSLPEFEGIRVSPLLLVAKAPLIGD